MGRELPSLFVLCLRAVGSHDCKAQVTFHSDNDNDEKPPTTATKLLQAFHRRGNSDKIGVDAVPLSRIPLVGLTGTARRAHANDVDINHPVIAASDENGMLVMQYGNTALDCLQSYIDSLVELGRMDDTRLTKEFFCEWIRCCNVPLKRNNNNKNRKRKRASSPVPPPQPKQTFEPCSSLSLQNCIISQDTFQHMIDTGVGQYVSVLDLSGISTLTDRVLDELLESCSNNLSRLSLKNCRRLTAKSLQHLATHCPQLTFLDIGGAFNISAQDVLNHVEALSDLVELHASGLGWTDHTLLQLVTEFDNAWQGLSLGFGVSSSVAGLSSVGLQEALGHVQDTLQRLALPFCEAVDTNFLGWLGKTMTQLTVLDIRGNSNINSLTPWLDGRAFFGSDASSDLFVLARYTNISSASLEETKRIHPVQASGLTCILDGGGAGGGIRR